MFAEKRRAGFSAQSSTYSAISSSPHSRAAHSLFSVFVSMFSFARSLRIVLLWIPHVKMIAWGLYPLKNRDYTPYHFRC